MKDGINKYVVSKRDLKTSDFYVEKDDVGMVESESGDTLNVFFIREGKKANINSKEVEFVDVKKVGDSFPKKICNVCHKLLNTTDFARNQNGINNRPVRRPSCQNCRKLLEGNNIKPSEKIKWNKNKPNYIPFECPICHKRTIVGVTSKIVLDHNHKTGEVRGWMCDSCNTGIGRFKDDIKILQRAIKYLENN